MPTTTTTYEWGTIGDVADLIGCSRRTLERALKRGADVDGHTVEQRDATEADYARDDVTRRTSRLVRAVDADGEPLLLEVEIEEPPEAKNEPEPEPDDLDPELAAYVGRRVLLTGDHPHAQRTGEIVRYQLAFGSIPSFVVRLDDGHECGVTDPAHLQFLDAEVIRLADFGDEEFEEVEEWGDLDDEIDERVSEAFEGTGSPEETLHWLEKLRRGKIKEWKMTGGAGRKVKKPVSMALRLKAGVEAEKLREFIDERERNYIPKMDVANALVTVGSLLRHRMQAVPARLADRVAGASSRTEARQLLDDEIHTILTELGDATERELEKLLEAEAA